MTRISKTRVPGSPDRNHWRLQDAKARLSEIVRRVRKDGPQHVTVHGRDEVVIIAAEDYLRMKGGQTGAALVAVMQACPDARLSLEQEGARSPVRDVEI